ncbi:MAG: class I SAM-dependent methyltransferase, partial [archaeon]|nr:class I SAM-dependent methyltransferase [archaeon]
GKLFKKNSFDAIVALELIEHIPPKEIFKLYEMICHLLKPGGIFIITTPTNEGLRDKKTCLPAGRENPSGHVRDYTIPILEMELSISGFKILNKKTLFAFQTNYRIKKHVSLFLKNRWRPNNILIAAKKV